MQLGFLNFVPMSATPLHTKKGRNETLIAGRNKLLIARFYFYSTITRLKFSTCLEILEKEFFLSQARITDLLAENSEYICYLEIEQYSTAMLRDYFPFMNWQHYHHGKTSQKSVQLFLDLS